MLPIERRRFWTVCALWLVTVTAFLIWFDYAAATAFLHPAGDPMGRTLFQVPGYSNTVYPFTYAGVAASVLGVSICVYREERPGLPRIAAAVLAFLVGNLASIGMIDTFEQIFVGLRYYTGFGHGDSVYWLGQYWGSYQSAGVTLGGMLPVLAVLPWSRRRNWTGVALCLGVYGLAMAVWFLHGYSDPQNGDAIDYGMNALARIASQLALVAAVLPKDALTLIREMAANLTRRFSPAPTAPAEPGQLGTP